jgi:hypothetical protein
VGVLFANLSFKDKDNMLQIPKTGVILGKDVIRMIVGKLDKNLLNELKNLPIFKIPDSELDEYFNFIKFNPKF